MTRHIIQADPYIRTDVHGNRYVDISAIPGLEVGDEIVLTFGRLEPVPAYYDNRVFGPDVDVYIDYGINIPATSKKLDVFDPAHEQKIIGSWTNIIAPDVGADE